MRAEVAADHRRVAETNRHGTIPVSMRVLVDTDCRANREGNNHSTADRRTNAAAVAEVVHWPNQKIPTILHPHKIAYADPKESWAVVLCY